MSENVLSLRPWDAVLRRGQSKAADLLKRSDLPAVVGALSPLEAYTTVKALGPADAAPVLACLNPEQTQALLDLEAWYEHRLSAPDLILWLSAFREASVEAMQQAADALDFEALSAFLRRRLYVAQKPSEERSDDDPVPDWLADPPKGIEPIVETPDGRFIIAARPSDADTFSGVGADGIDDEDIDEEDRKWVLTFVNELYQQEDWERVAAVLRSAAFDLTSNLEEDAYRFRSARLEDLGFPPRERAIEIYGLLDPADSSPLPPAPSVDLRLPVVYVPPLQQGIFQAALQQIDDPKQMNRLEGDLVAVANKALVADGVAPGQFEAMQEVLQRLRGYVELALVEGVAPSERTQEAVHRLTSVHLERLFRVGYTLTVRTAGRARRILEQPALGEGSRDLALRRLPAGEQGVLEALLLRRPRVSGALEPFVERVVEGASVAGMAADLSAVDSALDDGAAEVRRPFLSWADLVAVRWVLSDLEAFIDAWAASPPERAAMPKQVNLPVEERTIDIELATALARVILGGRYAIVPLSGAELADLADGLTLDSTQKARFSEAVLTRAIDAAGGPRVAPRVRRTAARLAEQLWPHVGRDRIDPRFIDAVLTDLTSEAD